MHLRGGGGPDLGLSPKKTSFSTPSLRIDFRVKAKLDEQTIGITILAETLLSTIFCQKFDGLDIYALVSYHSKRNIADCVTSNFRETFKLSNLRAGHLV